MSKQMVTLKDWKLTHTEIQGQCDWVYLHDEVVAVAKESDDVLIIEGTQMFYKLDPPWRMK